MSKKQSRGFSLVELMAVVVIIAITCAVMFAGIVQLRYRNTLTETVSSVQEGALLARTLALQTRQAAVMEVRPDKVWVNLLGGAFCDSSLIRRCLSNFNGTDDLGEMVIAQGLAQSAGVAMCGGGARILQDGVGGAAVCANTALPREGFALCYTGTGELYTRNGPDANMECNSGASDPAVTNWTRACGSSEPLAVNFEDGTTYELYDGAIVIFNRYKHGYCGANAEGVRRGLFFPSGGAPFSKVAGVAEVTD